MSVPVGRRSVAPGPPDLHRLASYGRGLGSRRRRSLLPLLVVLLLAAVGAGGFALGRVTAPGPETVVAAPATSAPAGAPVTSVVSAVPVTAAVIHEIQQGENLQEIADLYGVTQAQLIAFNDIVDPNRIFWGLRLRIPPADWEPPAPTTTASP